MQKPKRSFLKASGFLELLSSLSSKF